MNSHVACKIEAKLKAATGRIFRCLRNVRIEGLNQGGVAQFRLKEADIP